MCEQLVTDESCDERKNETDFKHSLRFTQLRTTITQGKSSPRLITVGRSASVGDESSLLSARLAKRARRVTGLALEGVFTVAKKKAAAKAAAKKAPAKKAAAKKK